MKSLDPPYNKGTGFLVQGTQGVNMTAGKNPDVSPVPEPDAGRFFSIPEDKAGSSFSRRKNSAGQDVNVLQDRMNRNGRVKLCVACGGIMKKSSRTLLSIPAGISLVMLGIVFMTSYGFATNFYHVPWFIKFALPAAYYIGSIFVAVGLLFFFIKEKTWKCERCGEISKR
jgi:hypothetical protein